MIPNITYAVIEQPIGETYCARCEADVFEKGILTISSIDEPDAVLPVRVFQPGQWKKAIVFDRTGHPLYWFYASESGTVKHEEDAE